MAKSFKEKREEICDFWISHFKGRLENYKKDESAFSEEYLTSELLYWQYEKSKLSDDLLIAKYQLKEIEDTLRMCRNYIREKEVSDLPPSSLYKSIVKNQKWLNDIFQIAEE